MVTHLAEYQSPTGTLCARERKLEDCISVKVECVDCPECMKYIALAHERRAAGYGYRYRLAYLGPGGSVPADFQGLPPPPKAPARTDEQLLDLLARARAQGVRQLELHADGGVVAVMDPAPPPAPPFRPGIDPRPLSPEEQAQQDEAELVARGG